MRILLLTALTVLLIACGSKQNPTEKTVELQEDKQAKALLQGVWIESETEEVSFRAKSDTIYYPDSTSQPAYFRIINDSLFVSGRSYMIEKQSEHIFNFRNQNGELVQLVKSEDPIYMQAFQQRKPHVLTYTSVVNRDSVVLLEGERYHWYITINPTKYKVVSTSYNDEGVGVENAYYDNIIHISLFQGAHRLFSSDFKKQMFSKMIPGQFLEQSILSNIEYDHADARGFHFNATLCKPDGVSCYVVAIVIDKNGKHSMSLQES
jgi:hypothetical protein